MWPDAVRLILRSLATMQGGVIGLVGLQGVGKSGALLAILIVKMVLWSQHRREQQKNAGEATGDGESDIILFKWRRQAELFPSLFDGTHEASASFRREYGKNLLTQLEPSFPLMDFKEVRSNPERLNFQYAEGRLGRASARQSRQVAWLEMLRRKRVILIDTPDYSRTDRRLMARDLDEIYWLWNYLSKSISLHDNAKPNLVVAIQKEMFRGHFFFDKMQKIELTPLRPEQMLEAYLKRFKTPEPFTEDAILLLARMSRGIFRLFLRYITLTLDKFSRRPEPQGLIDQAEVKASVTPERLARDMEVELTELFPKHSDLRLHAVRLLMYLEESGATKQAELADQLGLEPYTLTRLLARLELHGYVRRERSGVDKLVTFTEPID